METRAILEYRDAVSGKKKREENERKRKRWEGKGKERGMCVFFERQWPTSGNVMMKPKDISH